jgi:hypothetical protein
MRAPLLRPTIRKHAVGTLPRVSRPRTRWEEDNVAPVNVGAFVAIGGVVLVIVGLAVLLALT